MTPFYLQTDTEAGVWAALTELGFVSEHEGERQLKIADKLTQRGILDNGSN